MAAAVSADFNLGKDPVSSLTGRGDLLRHIQCLAGGGAYQGTVCISILAIYSFLRPAIEGI